MEHRNLSCGSIREKSDKHLIVKGRPAKKHDKEDNCAYYVKHKVNNSGTFTVGICSDTGKNCGNAGTDVGTEDYVKDSVSAPADNDSACRHGNENTGDC